MKKSFAIIALAALVMLASCKKDEQQPTGTKLRAGIEQQKSDSKTSLNPNDLTISWTSGDQLYVNNGSEAAQFTLTSGAGTATGEFATTGDYTFASANNVAVYPYNENIALNGTTLTMTLPATQTASAGTFGNGANPMLGVFDNPEQIQLTSLCGALCLQLTGDNIDITAIEIEGGAADKLNGTFTVDYTNPTLTYSENGTNKVTLNLTQTVTLNADPKKFFVVLPAGTLHGFTMNVKNGENVIFSRSTANNITFTANFVETMAEMTVTAGPTIPTGALAGYYSVSPTRQVYFAHGNLMCSKAAGTDWATADYTWSFMNHQYDMVETCDGFTLNNHHNTDNIDLYLWGASGIAGTATYYEPWRTTGYEYNVIRNDVGAADMPNTLDWGYNTIETKNGQIQPTDGWRTLTFPEWSYLLYTRRLAGNRLSYGKATITGVTVSGVTMNVKGLIILPDDYYDYNDGRPDIVLPSVPALYYGDDNGNYSDNVLTGAEWDALEQNYGVTFLPAVGWIDPSQSNGSSREWQDAGVYWSSTGEDGSYAEYIRFGSDYMFISAEQYGYYNIQLIHSHRAYGHCVRLAHDVQ